VKLSDALHEFASPLISLLPPDAPAEDIEAMLGLAYLVWNGVVLEELGRESPYIDEAKSVVRGRMPAAARRAVLALITELEKHKRAETPPDLRVIGEFSVRPDRKGGFNLQTSQVAPPPEATPRRGTWGELYSEAVLFLSLAPWHKIGDEHLFGVRDPATGEVGWCCVMGSAGTLMGLAVYRGHVGFDFWRRLQCEELDQEDALYGQEALTLVYADRNDLPRRELRRLRELGFSFRGRARWPQFENHKAGRLPVPLDELEAERMLYTLRGAIDLIVNKRDEPGWAKPDANGRLLVRSLRDGEWVEERVAPPQPIERRVPQFDSVRAERLKHALPRSEAELECDVRPMGAVIEERKGQGYMPAHFVLADRATGAVVHHKLGRPKERDQMAQVELMTGLERLGSRPAVVLVRRPSVERVIRPVVHALGVEVRLVDDLPHLDEMHAFLQEMLDDAEPGKCPGRP
jgi:hypothetical protein